MPEQYQISLDWSRSRMEPLPGLEPGTFTLQKCCSTTELKRRVFLVIEERRIGTEPHFALLKLR